MLRHITFAALFSTLSVGDSQPSAEDRNLLTASIGLAADLADTAARGVPPGASDEAADVVILTGTALFVSDLDRLRPGSRSVLLKMLANQENSTQ